jgi:hypothetical protein
MEMEIEKPIKDKLLLQGPNHGFLTAEDSHIYTSIFAVYPKIEGDAEMKNCQKRRALDR